MSTFAVRSRDAVQKGVQTDVRGRSLHRDRCGSGGGGSVQPCFAFCCATAGKQHITVPFSSSYSSPYSLWSTTQDPLSPYSSIDTSHHHTMARDRLAAMRVGLCRYSTHRELVLIGNSSGSADCGQLFQQVCFHAFPPGCPPELVM